MYEQKLQPMSPVQSEHENFGNEVYNGITNFGLEQQNEILNYLNSRLQEERRSQICSLKKQAEELDHWTIALDMKKG